MFFLKEEVLIFLRFLPSMYTSPLWGSKKRKIKLTNVDLPDPLGP